MIRKLAVAIVTSWLLYGALPVAADHDAGQRAWDEKRYDEALSQWRAAAGGGDAHAMLALGRLFRAGLGAPQNYVLAHMWLNLAASRGVVEAAEERDALAGIMVPDERAEAQRRAQDWRPEAARDETEQTVVDEASSEATDDSASTVAPPPRFIREAQSLLAELGYDPGAADGTWTDRTRGAYWAFLRDEGLEHADVLTREALHEMRAIAERSATDRGATTSDSAPAASEEGPDRGETPAAAQADSTAEPLPPDAVSRAAASGDIEGLKEALAAGANVNARDGKGWTALLHVADKGDLLLLPPLLEAQANLDVRAPDGTTPLFVAAAHGHEELVAALVAAGANASIRGPGGKTAMEAGRLSFGEADKYWSGPEPNEVVYWFLIGMLPVHAVSAFNTNPGVLERLIERGAEVDGRMHWSMTPLHMAASYNDNPDVLRLLIEHGAEVNARDSFEGTPLGLAVEYNDNPDVAAYLRSVGAR